MCVRACLCLLTLSPFCTLIPFVLLNCDEPAAGLGDSHFAFTQLVVHNPAYVPVCVCVCMCVCVRACVPEYVSARKHSHCGAFTLWSLDTADVSARKHSHCGAQWWSETCPEWLYFLQCAPMCEQNPCVRVCVCTRSLRFTLWSTVVVWNLFWVAWVLARCGPRLGAYGEPLTIFCNFSAKVCLACTCAVVCVCMCVCACVCVHVCVCLLRLCMCVYVCVYACNFSAY